MLAMAEEGEGGELGRCRGWGNDDGALSMMDAWGGAPVRAKGKGRVSSEKPREPSPREPW